MAFSEFEKAALLEVKGVGPTVVERIEETGIDSFGKLSAHSAGDIAEMVTSMLRTICWKSSPKPCQQLRPLFQGQGTAFSVAQRRCRPITAIAFPLRLRLHCKAMRVGMSSHNQPFQFVMALVGLHRFSASLRKGRRCILALSL